MLNKLAGLAIVGMGVSFATSGDERCFVHDPKAKRAAYTSKKPLTKRQKRRLRGKNRAADQRIFKDMEKTNDYRY